MLVVCSEKEVTSKKLNDLYFDRRNQSDDQLVLIQIRNYETLLAKQTAYCNKQTKYVRKHSSNADHGEKFDYSEKYRKQDDQRDRYR